MKHQDPRKERDYLLTKVNAQPLPPRAPQTKDEITPEDYVAVAQPYNLNPRPVGDCLAWRRGLNADGYGYGSFGSGEKLAHRQAFYQSRGYPAKKNVLHFCHRPCCIQPSHLYEGTHQDNANDRALRLKEGLHWDKFATKAEAIQRASRYRWQAPSKSQPNLLSNEIPCNCRQYVPAMDTKVYPNCGKDQRESHPQPETPPQLQPESSDANSAEISGHSRTVREIAPGVEIHSNVDYTISVPLNRAERRRRQKAHEKDPLKDQVQHLGTRTSIPDENGRIHSEFKLPEINGPGLLVITGRVVPRNNPHEPRLYFPTTPIRKAPSTAPQQRHNP